MLAKSLLLLTYFGYLIEARVQYATCIACYSYFDVGVNPCKNVQQKITKALTARFMEVFTKYDIQPSYPSWEQERPSRDSSGRDLRGDDDENYIGTLLISSSTGSVNGISCRSLCSEYPDCSSWCPSSTRRSLHEPDSTNEAESNGKADNQSYLYEEGRENVLIRSTQRRHLRHGPAWAVDDMAVQIELDIERASYYAFQDVLHTREDVISESCWSWIMYSTCQARATQVH